MQPFGILKTNIVFHFLLLFYMLWVCVYYTDTLYTYLPSAPGEIPESLQRRSLDACLIHCPTPRAFNTSVLTVNTPRSVFAWIINNHGRFNELCWGSTGGEDARGVAGDDDGYVRGHGGWHAGHCGLGRGHDSAATPARSQVIRLVYRVKAPRSTSSGGVWCSAHRENFS